MIASRLWRSLTRRFVFKPDLPLALLLIARLAVGLTYSLINPIWEAYDEDGHFAYAYYLARHWTLLRPGDPEAEQVWEKFQPPLYYLLAALPLTAFDLSQPFSLPAGNPFLQDGTSYNYALHPDHLSDRDSQIALAVMVVRAVGVVLCTVSVFFVYRSARLMFPTEHTTARAITVVYAFWPLFLFVGGMVTNDALVTVLSAIGFYFALRLAQTGFRLRYALLLSLILGAALVTKLNAFALLPTAVVALGMSLTINPMRRLSWGSWRVGLAVAVIGLAILAALRFLTSQYFVITQVFQTRTVFEFLRLTREADPSSFNFVIDTLRYSFRTFLASYGWGNLETHKWVYWLWSLGAVLALAGLLISVFRRRLGTRWRIVVLLAVLAVSQVGLALTLAISQQNSLLVPGRFLLPALPAISGLLVTGWRAWLPRGWRPYAWKIVSLTIVLVGWSVPLWKLAPAYAKPQPQTTPAEISSGFHFGETIELVGYNRPAPTRPGQEAHVTLCWQALAPISQNYTVFLEIVGPDGQGYGRLATYPGRGNYATSLWAVRVPFCDHYAVPVGATLPAPAIAEVRVSLLLTTDVNGERLPLLDDGGRPIVPRAVGVPLNVVASSPAPDLAQRVEYHFGDGLILRGYAVTPMPDRHQVRVALRWEALRDLTTDYVIFVHLRDTPTHAYTQGDGPPRNGWYPTSLWHKGDTVLDEHTLPLPPGVAPPLTLYVGVLRADTHVRLPATDAAGRLIPNGEVILERDLTLPSVP